MKRRCRVVGNRRIALRISWQPLAAGTRKFLLSFYFFYFCGAGKTKSGVNILSYLKRKLRATHSAIRPFLSGVFARWRSSAAVAHEFDVLSINNVEEVFDDGHFFVDGPIFSSCFVLFILYFIIIIFSKMKMLKIRVSTTRWRMKSLKSVQQRSHEGCGKRIGWKRGGFRLDACVCVRQEKKEKPVWDGLGVRWVNWVGLVKGGGGKRRRESLLGLACVCVCSHGDGNLSVRANGARAKTNTSKREREKGKKEKKNAARPTKPPKRATPKREVDTRSRPESCLFLFLLLHPTRQPVPLFFFFPASYSYQGKKK